MLPRVRSAVYRCCSIGYIDLKSGYRIQCRGEGSNLWKAAATTALLTTATLLSIVLTTAVLLSIVAQLPKAIEHLLRVTAVVITS
jgi:hypothetical protein